MLPFINIDKFLDRMTDHVTFETEIFSFFWFIARVSVQGVESLWGDCRFIPADGGS